MRQAYAWALAASVFGCGGSHTSPQNPAEAPVASSSPLASAAPLAPPTASAAPAPAKTSAAPPGTISTAKAHTEGQHYVLDVKAPGRVAVGEIGVLEIVLSAKDGYHVNEEFPYKLRTAVEPPGFVVFEKPELTRAHGIYTKTEARFNATFGGAKVGEGKIGGLMSLSVCTAKECVTDKVELEVPVTVR